MSKTCSLTREKKRNRQDDDDDRFRNATTSSNQSNIVWRCARPMRHQAREAATEAIHHINAPPPPPVWGSWDFGRLIFHDRPIFPSSCKSMILLKNIRDIHIERTLSNIIKNYFMPLEVRAVFYNNPVSAFIRTKENIEFYIMIFHPGSEGNPTAATRGNYAISFHHLPPIFVHNDPLHVSRHRIQIREAAVGNKIVPDQTPERVLVSKVEQIRVLEQQFDNNNNNNTSNGNGEMQTTAKAELKQALDNINNEFLSIRNQSAEDHLALQTVSPLRRQPFVIPRESTNASREVRAWVIDSINEYPRQQMVYLLAGPTAFRLFEFPAACDNVRARVRPRELLPSLGPHGRISLCERLTQGQHATTGYAYRKEESRTVAVIEMQRNEFHSWDPLIAIMTSRMLECNQILEDEDHIYFVCHEYDSSCFHNQDDVVLPTPGLRFLVGYHGSQRELHTHRKLKTWFRNLVLAIDASLQDRFAVTDLDPTGRSSKWQCNHWRQLFWILGQILFECLTGISFPVPSDRLFPFFIQYWFRPNGSYFNFQVPDGVMRIVQANFMEQFNSHNGPVGDLLDLIFAVRWMPPDARDLVTQLLNQRFASVEDILRHPYLMGEIGVEG